MEEVRNETTGRWQVHTLTALYLLDLDARTALRVPDAGAGTSPTWSPAPIASFATDHQPVPLLAVLARRLNQPMLLYLLVAEAGLVYPRLRLSTPVQAIRSLPPGIGRADQRAEASPAAPTLARLLGIQDDEHGWSAPAERPFEDFGQYGHDALDLRVFDQDTWWVDRYGRPHRLQAMPTAYRRNVIAFLAANTAYFYAVTLRRHALTALADLLDQPPGAPIDTRAIRALTDHTPSDWLRSTPLMRRLRSLDPTPPEDGHDPGGAECPSPSDT